MKLFFGKRKETGLRNQPEKPELSATGAFCCRPAERCCPPVPEDPFFYAQFGVSANPASGSFLPLFRIFGGEEIGIRDNNTVVLPPGYLYLVNYVFQAVPEADSYFQIVPYLNGSPRLITSFFAPSGTERNASAAGSFTTNEAAGAAAELAFSLTYPEKVRNIDITGTVSVTPLHRLTGR